MPLPLFPLWYYSSMLASQGWPRKSGILGKPSVPAQVLVMVGKLLGELGRAWGAERPDIAMRLITQYLSETTWPDVNIEDDFHQIHVKGWPVAAVAESWTWDQVVSRKEFHIFIRNWFLAETWHGLKQPVEVRQAFDDIRAEADKWKSHGLDIAPALLPRSAAELAAEAVEYFRLYEAAGGVIPQATPSLVRYVELLRAG